MKKTIDFIKNIWYNVKLSIYLWKESRILNSINVVTKKNNLESLKITKEYSLYLDGIRQIKKQVNSKASNKQEYEETLSSIDDLTQYAVKYNDKDGLKLIETLKKTYVYKQEKPQVAIINDRIKHYKELHSHIEKRQKLREARKNGQKETPNK